MKKVLHTIRSKSHEFRMTLAVILSLVVTLGVGALWVGTLGSLRDIKQSKAPSPFSALGATIKSTVKNSDFKSSNPFSKSDDNQPQLQIETETQSTTNTEIIDAGDTSIMHDETNPYQSAP